MAWTTIPNADIDQDSPITQTLVTALRDNPIAIADGDPGAPRVQAIAAMSHQGAAGAIGLPVFARRTSGTADISFGGTIGGSSLSPTSAVWGATSAASAAPNNLPTGSPLNGTYRCLGTYTHEDVPGDGFDLRGATLWLRIS